MSEFRVLIVEDNADTRELLREQLDDPRFELISAGDGQDAILRIGDLAPHVVIMDVMMPHLDGYETSRYLKLRFRDQFIPILMLTAKSDDESRDEGARFGCEDYRGKPYTRKQLLGSVNALLELGRLENSLLDASRARETGEDGPGLGALQIARERVVELRVQLAERQLNERSVALAKNHLERVLELAPEHKSAAGLMERVNEEARQ